MSEPTSPLRRRIVLVALWLAVAGFVWLFDGGVVMEARTLFAGETAQTAP